MDETPHEPLPRDEDHHGHQDDPAATNPQGGRRPPDTDHDDAEDEYEYEHQPPSRRRILSGGRLAAAVVAVLVLLGGGAALALDGGGDDDDAASSSDDDRSAMEDAASEFAQCMRDQGVEDFPDPQVSGDGGISIGGSVAERRDSEEMEAANEACQHILDDAEPEGQQLTPGEVAELQDQALAMAQCMRDRGYDFPDPEVDENGGIRIRIEGGPGGPGGPGGAGPGDEQFQQDQEECSEASGLGSPRGGEGGFSTSGEGGA